MVGFFDAEANKEDVEAFEAYAAEHRHDMRFAMATAADVKEANKVKSGMVVYVYKAPKFVSDKYDKKKARYPGKSLDAKALAKFVNKKALPLVAQKTWKSNAMYEAAGKPVLTLFTSVDLEKNAKG